MAVCQQCPQHMRDSPKHQRPRTDPKDWPNAQSFRSEHSGGLNFAVADGASRVISASVDLKVYRALATIDGKEVVGDNY